ncbi:MAG: exodeoxyribonuclease VII large subunit [Campylobacterales bacterium]|nr:exodeoxyribonuclease VII large subunit [Campylobacterales bacterium]
MKALTVSTLNEQIKSLLETTFVNILVEGEVSSFTYHTSGHLYFSIKDNTSSIKCVMFRSSVAKTKFRLEMGAKIIVEGSVGVYTPRGEYQFYVTHIEPFGQGALALAFEQLKKRLQAKGYFEKERKKTIPKYISTLALVTAKNSAALHDMLTIIDKRYRALEVTIIDTLVQGEMAPVQIARALQFADSLNVDAVVVGRGGGSIEDLWAFNEEIVADAIFAMKTPVVSAVGHEIDTVISDFVADLRAPTPSAAIEMILPDQNELLFILSELQERYQKTYKHPLYNKEKRVESLQKEFGRLSIANQLQRYTKEFATLKNQYRQTLSVKLHHKVLEVPKIKNQLKQHIVYKIAKERQKVDHHIQQLQALNPNHKYKNGWAQVSHEGVVVTLDKIKQGEKFILQDSTDKIEALRL